VLKAFAYKENRKAFKGRQGYWLHSKELVAQRRYRFIYGEQGSIEYFQFPSLFSCDVSSATEKLEKPAHYAQ
jgi:hypothetical protein